MAVFSVNQVTQLYVAKKYVAASATGKTALTNKSNEGSISLIKDSDGENIYLSYRGAENLMRSDLIKKENILYAKGTKAEDLKDTIKSATITLDPKVNGGIPLSGQDYVVRIAFRQYVGMSDEDQWFKHGAVHAIKDMTPAEFYNALAISLFRNFSREAAPLVTFTLGGKVVDSIRTKTDGTAYLVDADGAEIVADGSGVTLTEAEQEWRLGLKSQGSVYFEIYPTTITVDGDEVCWGKVAKEDAGKRGNGRKIADLEYFFMGERADQYRGIAWPHNLETKYLVDPSEDNYCTFNIHYAYVAGNEGPQKSEKDITVVGTAAEINKLIAAFNTATGMTVATV